MAIVDVAHWLGVRAFLRPRALLCSVLSLSLASGPSCGDADEGPEEFRDGDSDPPDGEGAAPAAVASEVEGLREQDVDLAPSSPVGALEGRSWTDDHGQSHYAIDLDAAPGPRGMAPALTLGYSTAGGNGLYGVGFSLSGFSQVVRCPRSLAKDGEYAALAFDELDPVCYAGHRLILETGAYGADGSTYRLEADLSKKFQLRGALEGDCYWRLFTADGNQTQFAAVGDNDTIDRWPIARVEDRFGNRIDYEWTALPDYEAVPSAIVYGGTGTDASRRRIRFVDEAREDEHEGWHYGQFQRQTRRIHEIVVEGPNAQVLSRYGLDYEYHPITRQSILTSIIKFDGAGVALPPTTFAWSGLDDSDDIEDGALSVTTDLQVTAAIEADIRQSKRIKIADFDGDAQDEILTFDSTLQSYDVVSPINLGTDLEEADVYLSAGDNILPGGWEAVEGGSGLHRIQSAPGLEVIKFHEGLRDQLLVPITEAIFDDNDRDPWGISYVDYLRVAVPISDWNEPEIDQLEFDYVPYYFNDPIYSVIPVEYNGDGRDDLFLCMGQGYKSSHWYIGISKDLVLGDQYGWNFYDMGVGCSTHDEYTILQTPEGTDTLAVIPRYETDPALMDYPEDFGSAAEYDAEVEPISEASRSGYRMLRFDLGTFDGSLDDVAALPRDLYQRWSDLKCNNGYVADVEGAPLLGVGMSADRRVDVDGDGKIDILRFELETEDLTQITAAQDDDGAWDAEISCQDVGQNAVIRVYRNTGVAYQAMPTPMHTFFGRAHDNFWLNWQGAQIRDWNLDGLTDIVLPSDSIPDNLDDPEGQIDDWAVLLSDGDGSATLVEIAGGPSPWPYYVQGSETTDDFEQLTVSRAFSARAHGHTKNILIRDANCLCESKEILDWRPVHYYTTQTDDNGEFEAATLGKIYLESATDGLGLIHTFVMHPSKFGGYLTVLRDITGLGYQGYDYSDPVAGVYGSGYIGFSWIRQVEGPGAWFGPVEMQRGQLRTYDLTYDPVLRTYPRAGAPNRIESAWVSDYTLDNEEWHVSCSLVSAWGAHVQPLPGGLIWQVYPATTTSFTTTQPAEGYNNRGPGHGADPAPQTGHCDGYDSDEYTSLTTTTQLRDQFGNPLSTSQSVTDGVSEATTTTTTYGGYIYDTVDWFINAAQSVEVESCVGGACKVRSTSITYDGDLQAPVTTTRELGSAFEQTTTLGYDAHGNVDSVQVSTPSDGSRTVTTLWDAEGVSPESRTNDLLQTSYFVHDVASGMPIALVDPNGLTTKQGYDGFYRPVASSFHSSPLGPSDGGDIEIEYDDGPDTQPAPAPTDRRMERIERRRGQSVTTSINPSRQVTRRMWFATGSSATFPVADELSGPAVCQWYRYESEFGQRTGESIPSEHCAVGSDVPSDLWRSYEYDLGHRPTSITWTDGNQEAEVSYDYLDVESTESTKPGIPSVAGFPVVMTDADGKPSTKLLDALGRTSATIDADGILTCFDHGPFGELQGVHRNCASSATGRTESSSFTHDAVSRLVTSTEPATGAKTHTYTEFDEIDVVTDAKLQTVDHDYDVLGRLVQRTTADGVASWAYDTELIGAMTSRESEDDVDETFEYDAFGRLAASHHRPPSLAGIPPRWWTFEFTYDALGRISTIEYPTAPPGNFVFVPQTSFTATFDYDGRDYLRSVSGADRTLWGLVQANEVGLPELERFNVGDDDPSHEKETQYYPGTFRVHTIDVQAVGPQMDYQYGWSLGGNLTTRTEGTTGQSETFGYDDLHRLVSIGGDDVAIYDKLGNLQWKEGVGDYNYNATTGRLKNVANALNVVPHDNNGNVKTFEGLQLSWDPLDRVASTTKSGVSTTYHYDASGSRVVRHNAEKQTITLLGLFEFTRTAGSPAQQQARYFVPAGSGNTVEVRDSGVQAGAWTREVFYQYADHLGSGAAMVSEDGPSQRVSYDIWGNAREWNDWTEPLDAADLEGLASGFTGHQAELDDGLINMRGRMYSPRLSRFMSADPVVADVGDAQSWNSYSYVGNNPLRYVDPSGFCKVPHEPDCDCCGEGGVGGKSGGGSGGGSDGEGSVPQTIPPHPGDGTSNGEAPATGPGVPPHANGGHSDMPGAQRSSNGAGQGGPPIKYVDLGEIEVTPCNIGDDYSNCASGPEAQPEDTGAEIGAAAFDWFIDDGIGTTLKFTSWGTYSLIEPEGGLGPWVRVEAGSLLENDFGLLENDFGELGKSSTYGSASLGLDVLTIIATFRLGSGPPAPKSLPVQGQVQGVWFSSFDTLKANIPSGSKTWHHIVEQSAGFPTWLTNNIGNVIRLDPITHRMISKFYSTSKAPFTNGKVVRKWLKGRSFDEHYETGMWVLRQFGVVP